MLYESLLLFLQLCSVCTKNIVRYPHHHNSYCYSYNYAAFVQRILCDTHTITIATVIPTIMHRLYKQYCAIPTPSQSLLLFLQLCSVCTKNIVRYPHHHNRYCYSYNYAPFVQTILCDTHTITIATVIPTIMHRLYKEYCAIPTPSQ